MVLNDWNRSRTRSLKESAHTVTYNSPPRSKNRRAQIARNKDLIEAINEDKV